MNTRPGPTDLKIGITDSGVGGLSVCAAVEAGLRRKPVQADVEILYLNAALRDDYSYNSMATRQEKLEAFDCFLHNVAANYRPEMLFIACNTLSILFQDPYFDKHRDIPIEGIVDTATASAAAALREHGDSHIIVFATPTTIAEGTYGRRLLEAGIPASRIAQQACPDLPDAISNDFTGVQARSLLKKFIPAALQQFHEMPAHVTALLGCTHYGYQAPLFEKLLRAQVENVSILNPNQAAALTILDQLESPPGNGKVDIRFITPYAIPSKPLRSLSHYLGGPAPATVEAMHQFTCDPDLYQPGGHTPG